MLNNKFLKINMKMKNKCKLILYKENKEIKRI